MSPLADRLSTLPSQNERPAVRGTSSDHNNDPQQPEATHASVAGRVMPSQGAALDEPLRRLARALGRDAARHFMARESSVIEVALVVVLAAVVLAIRLWSQQ